MEWRAARGSVMLGERPAHRVHQGGTAYPNAKLVAVRPFVGDFGTEISAQVAARNTGGDAKVYYVDTAGWTAPADFTDGLHPNASGSVKIADKLTEALQALP